MRGSAELITAWRDSPKDFDKSNDDLVQIIQIADAVGDTRLKKYKLLGFCAANGLRETNLKTQWAAAANAEEPSA